MIPNSSELDGSYKGSSAAVGSMKKDGGGNSEIQSFCSSSSSTPTNATSRAPSSIGNSKRFKPPASLPKKLLKTISAQLRRSVITMGSSRAFSYERGQHGGRSVGLLHHDAVERKVTQVIERVKSQGYSDEVCKDLRKHFSRLPARYALNVSVERHEDVLLHMNLLNDTPQGEEAQSQSSGDDEVESNFRIPRVHVRKVQLVSAPPPSSDVGGGRDAARKGVPIPRFPKPTFGSSPNLAGLLLGSPKVHPSSPITQSPSDTESSIIPPPTFGSLTNPVEGEDDSSEDDSIGYEITLATVDRRGLLKFFADVLSNSSLQLNIKEAHVFSTSDGLALQVFVVEGWTGGKPDDLSNAVLGVLNNGFNPALSTKASMDVQLKTAVEGLAYEDWTMEYKNLEIGERLGGGSSGKLFQGKYLSQEVAVKVMELDDMDSDNESGALRPVPAVELLQMFKQEVAIMRLVRHKNLVQFIGACSSWPKLCIVTELMAGGSVRDLMQKTGTGLEIPVAVKTLRHAARGMDFLHRRGIVHRDLKAANLLIEEHGVVKVCDFGVARLNPAVPSSFVSQNWRAEMTAETGTYRWMSPEVLEHKPYDHKADVYSFGITIWEVVTGEVPYSDLTPLQAAIGVVQRNLRPTMPATVPPKLKAIAEACWHQDPDQRPEFSAVVKVLDELVPPVAKKSFNRKKFFFQ